MQGIGLKTVTFDAGRLLSVSSEGLEYVDDQGCRCTIEFRTCRENVQRELRSGRWRPIASADSLTRYIGFRDVEATPPHIILASNPPTRFVFPMAGPSFNVPACDFQQFQRRLFMEAGVKTVDVT
jgi:hypothetical protein